MNMSSDESAKPEIEIVIFYRENQEGIIGHDER